MDTQTKKKKKRDSWRPLFRTFACGAYSCGDHRRSYNADSIITGHRT